MSDHPNNDPNLRASEPDGWHDYTLEQAEAYMVEVESEYACRFTGLGAAARDMTRLARRLQADRDEAVRLLKLHCSNAAPGLQEKIDAFIARIAANAASVPYRI